MFVFARFPSMKINRPAATLSDAASIAGRRRAKSADPVRWRGGFFLKVRPTWSRKFQDTVIADRDPAPVQFRQHSRPVISLLSTRARTHASSLASVKAFAAHRQRRRTAVSAWRLVSGRDEGLT